MHRQYIRFIYQYRDLLLCRRYCEYNLDFRLSEFKFITHNYQTMPLKSVIYFMLAIKTCHKNPQNAQKRELNFDQDLEITNVNIIAN